MSSAPLLEVQKLTVRFRGLTAVKDLDLRVEPGQIFAVIGPNGAGKTTVFNAITGIYEPSEGAVRFDGRDLRRPLGRKDLVKWLLVGLGVGVFLLLFASNVDLLWSVVVKQNFRGRESGFAFSEAWGDFKDYLAAEPRIERRARRYYVVTFDDKTPFGSTKTEEEARERLRAVVEMGKLGGREHTIVARAGGFAVLSADESRVLETFPTREEAAARVRAAALVEEEAAKSRRKRVWVFVLASLLGAGGAYAVWRQTRRTPSAIAARGIARTFQNIRLFQEMTVLENVLVGMDRHLADFGGHSSVRRVLDFAPALVLALMALGLGIALRVELFSADLAGALWVVLIVCVLVYIAWIGRMGAFRSADLVVEARAREESLKLLDFVGLRAKGNEISRNLAYGEQRRLEIARALATKPRLLLLDEPAAGMNPAETVSLMKLIREIRDRGITVLLIEHHMRVVMGISDRIAVLDYGAKIAEGTPAEIRADPRVIEAYLGKEDVE